MIARLKSCGAGICNALLEPNDPALYDRRHDGASPSRQVTENIPKPEPEILSTHLPPDWWQPPKPSSPHKDRKPTEELQLGKNGGWRPSNPETRTRMKLIPSMPAFLESMGEDPESIESMDNLNLRGFKRQLSTIEDQPVELKLTDDEEAHFEGISKQANGVAVVVFETAERGQKAEFELKVNGGDYELTSWSTPFSKTKVPPGLHKFHFRLGGARVLSHVYPVIGGSNVAIFSDALRRYIVGLGRSLYETFNDQEELLSKMTSFNLDTPAPPKEVTGGLKRMPRHASYSHGLNQLAEEDKAERTPRRKEIEKRAMRGATFTEAVFVGLYDTELALRIQPPWHTVWTGVSPKGGRSGGMPAMQLWAGSARMGKLRGQCEDACFVSTSAVGVADGVGGMSAFASFGVNSAKLAWELMDGARSSCTDIQKERPELPPQDRALESLWRSQDMAASFGASTICLATVKGCEFGVANLGDSGFMILRRGKHRLEIVQRSKEQHHRWNCPYQLTRLPPALARQFPDFACDTPGDADLYNCTIQEGDLVLLFTDGMRDNLQDHEIIQVAECALPPGISQLVGLPEYKTAPENIAKALALAAFERSCDRKAKVPFAESCRQHGYDYEGGKEDDITVVAAWVLQESMNLAGISNESDECTTALTAPSRSPTGTTASDASSEAGSTARARTKTS